MPVKIIKCNMWIRNCITVTLVNHKCKFSYRRTKFTQSLLLHLFFFCSRTYPFCPVGDYQTNGQSYYSTTAGGTYAATATANTPSTHATALPYLVPVDEGLLLNSSSQSHSRDSPHSLTVSFKLVQNVTCSTMNVDLVAGSDLHTGDTEYTADSDIYNNYELCQWH